MMAVTPEERIRSFKRSHNGGHLMKIDGFSKLLQHDIRKCKSSVFEVFGYKWKLILYPARKEEKEDFISLYLKIKDRESLRGNWVVDVDFKVFIVVQREHKWYFNECTAARFSSSRTIHGKRNLINHEQLFKRSNGYIDKDSVIFGAEILEIRSLPAPYNVSRAMGTAERLRLIENPPNNKFTWKITKFSTFNQEKHESHEFAFGRRKWRIQMYPKGFGQGKGTSFSVFLIISDDLGDATKTLVEYKLRILDQLRLKHQEVEGAAWFGRQWYGFGAIGFISQKELYDQSNGFLVNDIIYIGVEFKLISITEDI